MELLVFKKGKMATIGCLRISKYYTNKMRILFFGTPDFAVGVLDTLIKNKYQVVAVVTATDQPAGRGLKLQQSAVKQYATAHNISVLQPTNLKDETFLAEVQALHIDLQIVVAFRMMPEVLWAMPPLGTFNLHASLLPQYRGAAPINWAIINGDKQSGVTTFFLKQQIDTGNIILQQAVSIDENDTAGTLHDKLMLIGSDLVCKTIDLISKGNVQTIPQQTTMPIQLKAAPKIFKKDMLINFNRNVHVVYNHIRGLSPYPAAYFDFESNDGKIHSIKVYECNFEKAASVFDENIDTDNKTYLSIHCHGGVLHLTDVQLAGKKRMLVVDFLRGFKMQGSKLIIKSNT